MTKRVLRFAVPIDDQPRSIPDAPIVLFGEREQNPFGLDLSFDVWVEAVIPEGWPEVDLGVGDRLVQVVATGDPVPDSWSWLGSFIAGPRAWHLYEVA